MNLNIKGKTAIVCGSSSGLGKACAIQLAKEGVNLVICSRSLRRLSAVASEIHKISNVDVKIVKADLSVKKDIEHLVNSAIDTFGRIDILINNTGGPKSGTFFEFEDGDWDIAYNSLLLYIVRIYREVVPHMIKHKWGRIINITSLTVKQPAEQLILSNVFRTGVVSLAKTISTELIRNNITINNVCPGAFMTERAIELMTNKGKKENKSMEEIKGEAISTLPLGRFQEPDELGSLVAYLCSEQAKGITGTTIQIDGGIYKGLF